MPPHPPRGPARSNAGVLAEKLAAAEARAARAEAEAAASAGAARAAAAAQAELARWAAALGGAGLPTPRVPEPPPGDAGAISHGAEAGPGCAGAGPAAHGGGPEALVRMLGEAQADAAAARERLGAARAEACELRGARAPHEEARALVLRAWGLLCPDRAGCRRARRTYHNSTQRAVEVRPVCF